MDKNMVQETQKSPVIESNLSRDEQLALAASLFKALYAPTEKTDAIQSEEN